MIWGYPHFRKPLFVGLLKTNLPKIKGLVIFFAGDSGGFKTLQQTKLAMDLSKFYPFLWIIFSTANKGFLQYL